MGLDVSRDKKWMKMCIALWKEVEEQFIKKRITRSFIIFKALLKMM